MKRPSTSRDTPGGLPSGGVTRRSFLKGLGASAVSAAALAAEGVAEELAKANAEKVQGPHPVPMSLRINGETHNLQLEPRVTLLEALRTHVGLTGPKESCDRASCGACTVLLNGVPLYACSMLAIEAQGAEITTIEGLNRNGELTPIQQALVDHDGLQCGYCSPGFVMTLTALLRRNPRPTEADVRAACAGNLCRCGAYPRIFAAALAATGQKTTSKLEVIHLKEHAVA
ncbi:MAG: hypothetical protein A3G75_14340 [Verrucomicrobia bacterium RIFCSPLOWO2_12_FULL_64_8]|nr:MAG: hypothetical protein A3G75_14340 [Verrucomicrobia bacterium RIFCSPLOWO2_12_FULL_64_8]